MKDSEDEFVAFLRLAEPRLRVALVGAFGAERGREAANDALVYAWLHWDRVQGLRNPLGYLYRVGQSKARRRRLRPRPQRERPQQTDPWVEPGLGPALSALPPRQRQAVMLIEGYGFTFREVASVLEISVSSVQTHHRRGLEGLRSALGVKKV